MGRMDGRVAIVTGGASGIGEATVRLFVAEGARVVIADIQEEKGKKLLEELGPEASFQRTDVSRESNIKRVIDYALTRYKRLDCLVNNAGIAGSSVKASIGDISLEDFDQTIAVDLRGVFLGIKHAARVMMSERGGSIITTASTAGFRVGYAPHVYSTAKAAVIHLTRSVAMELGEHGIRVNCVCPGAIATPIFGKSLGLSAGAADQTLDKLKVLLKDIQPIQRAGMPEDVARAIVWLASDDASFVNGHALVVDGGLIGGQRWGNLQGMLNQMGSVLGVEPGAPGT